MKRLLWISLATLGLGVLALWLRPHITPVLHVAPNSELQAAQLQAAERKGENSQRGATAPAARCPRHTLEDDGVCIPVPRPTPPSVPLPHDEYILPVIGRGALVPAERAPLPAALRATLHDNAQTLVVRTRAGSRVFCATALNDAHIVELSDTAVVISGRLNDDATDGGVLTTQLTLAGFQSLQPELSTEMPCTAETLLGLSRDALVLFAPGRSDAGAPDVRLQQLLRSHTPDRNIAPGTTGAAGSGSSHPSGSPGTDEHSADQQAP